MNLTFQFKIKIYYKMYKLKLKNKLNNSKNY